ncbi:MAG: hypothetical protein DLM53_06675 [Candidatus Eremiobacter antarcticus]|nr:polyprenyl synthetase family protein [Candidatus Eremiobacteraeota bacterium]MBC5808666.1 polyprenyl synthetase family protein [Candidatus Eremiobacteraeota bacterium]PZR62154.1 MAG: hypothetical protein DLM53_06675 [Candidatus Eremiobacter sp. RRmetagenome_bin22]
MVSGSRSGLGLTAASAESICAFESYFCDFVRAQAVVDPVAHHILYHFGLCEEPNRRTGKRLRPRMTLAAATAYGCDERKAFPACAAIELLHNYSLIHDDIEDSDMLRHGRETLWSTFGIAHGVNAGDAVGALAQLALKASRETAQPEAAFAMLMDLAQANLDMCQGQAMDLALEAGAPAGTETYIEMIGLKTAALFGCAAALGARCADASSQEVERCRQIGCSFGLAFQIFDDVAGIWGSTDRTGKAAAGDLARKKKTFPIVWAAQNDPDTAARVIGQTYSTSGPLDAPAVARVQSVLEACGSRAAAQQAADNYLDAALQTAAGLEPLRQFLSEWRADAFASPTEESAREPSENLI